MVEYWDKRLTKFELTRVLGARALQISLGAPVLTHVDGDDVQALEIAKKEFFEGKVPMIVVRRYPNNEMERVDVSEPEIIDSIKGFF